jgi:hypothetical protein
MVLSYGVLKVIPYADQAVSGTTPDGVSWSYTPNLTPVFSFTDGDYCPQPGEPPVKLMRKDLAETHNIVNVEYLDRLNYYNTCSASASDIGDIAKYGPRVMSTVTLHQITSATVAKAAAQIILQADLYERNTFEWKVRADYSLLEPMDYVSLTESTLGLVNQVVRITEVEDSGDDEITLRAMLVPGVVRTTPLYNWQQAQGIFVNYNAVPGSIVPPVIFQMPPLPTAAIGGIGIGIAASGPGNSGTWGGCYVYCSTDGGTTYSLVGTITSPAKYGVLTASLPGVPDPDTTSTLSITLGNTSLQLPAGTTNADADNNLTLAIVDSGVNAEVLSYGAETLTSPGSYNLSYLRRGQYGSTSVAHASGATFVKLDGNIFNLTLDAGMSGRSLFFKFPSFNTFGRAVELLSAVTPYQYLLPTAASSTADLIARGSCAVKGAAVYKSSTAATAWDSDVISSQAFVSGAQAICRYGSGTWAIGLVTSTAATANPSTNMAFAVLAQPGVGYAIYESGVNVGTAGTSPPSSGDIIQVIYDGYLVHYYLNGNQVRSSAAQGKTLSLALAMNSPGAVAGSVEFTSLAAATPSQFLGTGNVVVNDTHIMKVGGVNAWDSCAFSLTGYTTCHVMAKWLAATDTVMVGLSSKPTASSSYTNANYAWYNNAGTYQIYESGVQVSAFTSVALTDLVAITYDGATVRYYLNGVLKRSVSAAGLTLWGFCPVNNAGGGLNSLEFGPTVNLAVADTAQLGVNAATSVVTQTTAGPLTATGPTTAVLATLAVPLATDPNQVIVVTITMEAMSNEATDYGGAVQFFALYSTSLGGNVSGNVNPASTSRKPMTVQYTFNSASVGGFVTSQTVSLAAVISGTQTATAWNVHIRAELVKR